VGKKAVFASDKVCSTHLYRDTIFELIVMAKSLIILCWWAGRKISIHAWGIVNCYNRGQFVPKLEMYLSLEPTLPFLRFDLTDTLEQWKVIFFNRDIHCFIEIIRDWKQMSISRRIVKYIMGPSYMIY